MKLNDEITKNIASAVSDVLEGKAPKKEQKKKVDEVEEPRPEGEKKFKKMHVVKKSGEKEDGTVMKEDEVEKEEEKEQSEKQKKYQAFFNKALKKFGVSSPDELEGDKKKEFFDYVDKNYEADKESD
jgi:hypothetical protein|tara:strand:+ start:11892 stop:12272 length:381 start_codon:yes stop_codon:yes gene_type:complete